MFVSEKPWARTPAYFYNTVASAWSGGKGSRGRIVVGVNTRRGVGFRHESSVNERVFRSYRKRRTLVELNRTRERSNLTGGFSLGSPLLVLVLAALLRPCIRNRRHRPTLENHPASSHPLSLSIPLLTSGDRGRPFTAVWRSTRWRRSRTPLARERAR